MKKIIFTLFAASVLNILSFGQDHIYFSFDQDTNYKKYFYIDSTDLGNIWQIGSPDKTIFSSAYTVPNVLVTDTTNTYPPNDTFSVIVRHIINNSIYTFVDLRFYYYINCDTLTDFGKLASSVDGGHTWIELTSDFTSYYGWQYSGPIFTGNSFGWKEARLLWRFSAFIPLYHGDTVLFKFTFISDGIDNHKDGWMIDDITCFEWYSSVPESELKKHNFILIWKGGNVIEIINKQENQKFSTYEIQLFDVMGKLVYTTPIFNQKSQSIDVSGIKSGLCFYKIISPNNVLQTGKIVIVN